MPYKSKKTEEKSRVYQWGFDYIVDAGDPDDLRTIEKAINKALDSIPGITVVGSMPGDTSWSQEEYGLPADESRQLRESDDAFVGNQKFTYGELKKAWNQLQSNVENDPFDSKNPPSGGYDIRNGYYCGERDWNSWDMDFSLEAITKELESVPELISKGDLEVYYNDSDANQADSDDHGIFIVDGKIDQVY